MQKRLAKETYKRDDILQKRPIIIRSLLIVATTYKHMLTGLVFQQSKPHWTKAPLFIGPRVSVSPHKKTYTCVKRDEKIYVTHTFFCKKKIICFKRDLNLNRKKYFYMCLKRPAYLSKETCIYMSQEIYTWTQAPLFVGPRASVSLHMRDLWIWRKRPIYVSKETCICNLKIYMSQETYVYEARHSDALDQGLLYARIYVYVTYILLCKYIYICVKRDLYICQQRPVYMFVKRDWLVWTNTSWCIGPRAAVHLHKSIHYSCRLLLYCRAKKTHMCRKKPVCMSKETCIYVCQTRLTCMKPVTSHRLICEYMTMFTYEFTYDLYKWYVRICGLTASLGLMMYSSDWLHTCKSLLTNIYAGLFWHTYRPLFTNACLFCTTIYV